MQAHIDSRSEKQADVRPGGITLDHTDGETLGGTGLGTCVYESSECLLSVDSGWI